PLALTFKVYCTDSHFINYTTPEILKSGQVLYFHSRMNGMFAQMKLHSSQWVSEDDFASVSTLVKQDIIDSSASLQKCCFVVNIVIGENAIEAFSKGSEAVFTLDFEAKPTIWQYYLMGEHIDSQTCIVDLDDNIGFEACDSEILATGKQAFIFRTQSALGLQEKSPYRFQLRSAQGNGSKVLIKRLPVASPGQQYQAVIDGNRAALSEIYINY
ncbi:MAG: hypothetical protein MJK04_35545, partial [Psychrosphaera sp.]|nr:hypothetical protein [Psychrosphaera sp.]